MKLTWYGHSAFRIEVGASRQNVYLGNLTGLVLHFPDDKTLYHKALVPKVGETISL